MLKLNYPKTLIAIILILVVLATVGSSMRSRQDSKIDLASDVIAGPMCAQSCTSDFFCRNMHNGCGVDSYCTRTGFNGGNEGVCHPGNSCTEKSCTNNNECIGICGGESYCSDGGKCIYLPFSIAVTPEAIMDEECVVSDTEVIIDAPMNGQKYPLGTLATTLHVTTKFNTCNNSRERRIYVKDTTMGEENFRELCRSNNDDSDKSFYCVLTGLQDNHRYEWYTTAANEKGLVQSSIRSLSIGHPDASSIAPEPIVP